MALEKVGVRATIEGLSAFENGMRRMDRSLEKYGDAALTAEKRTEILTGALKKVGLGLTAAAAASGALLFSAVRLAARVETLGIVTKVLGKNVGKTEKQIRDLEQAIVDEGITLRTARQAISLMIQSNVDLAKATDLARLAQDAAVIAGINSSEAFERLTFVITSGNVRMARTLGLQVSFAQGMVRMAEATGKTAAALTPLERIQARTSEVLRAGTNIAGAYTAAMESVGKAVTSLPRFLEESKRMLGEAWIPVYAKAVGFVTDSLKAWLNLSQSQRDVISMTLGMVTAVTGLLGALALIGAALPSLITGLTSLGVAMGIVASSTAAGLAIMGLLAVAVVAVGAAFVKLFQTIAIFKRGIQSVNDAFEEHKKEVLRTAGSYEEYRAEIIRSGLIVAKTRLNVGQIAVAMRRGGKEAVLAAAGIDIMSVALFDGARVGLRAAQAAERTRSSMAGMTTEAERAAKAAEKLRKEEERLRKEQERLGKAFDRLSKTIDLDITKQFANYKSSVDELTTTITELEKKKYLTKKQREQLETTREELKKLERQWDETTAKIIFDLAQQRLAIDGFTAEELKALRKLAGPQGLGLIDAAAVALLDSIDDVAVGLDRAGDQSDILGEDLLALQAVLLNSALSANELAFAILAIQSKSVTVTTTFQTKGDVGGAAGPPSVQAAVRVAQRVATAPSGAPAISPAMLARLFRRQTGGFLQAGRAAIVGERGPEIFAPRRSGMVLNNRFVGAINSLVAALKSAPALMSAPMTPSVSNANTTNNFSMNINTRAPVEPIISDFRTMRSIANAL